MLFQAIAILRHWRPQVRLLITTSDRLISPRQEQAKNLGIEDLLHLRLLGDLDISRVYGAVDAVVAPNHYEGFGLPALEALACGVPVVACRSGAYLETLEDHKTALLFQPGNAKHLAACLNEIFSNHDLKRSLVQEGLTGVKKFGADKVVPLYEKQFSEVLKARSGNKVLSTKH